MHLLKELCRDTVVITFKDIEKELKTHYHFGNVEGINVPKGKELSVWGLPNLDEVVYGLYAMRAGTSLAKVHMYPQKITCQNKSFFLNTYAVQAKTTALRFEIFYKPPNIEIKSRKM